MRTPRHIPAVAILAIGAALTACSQALRPVTFEATPADWQRLAGEWRGDYWMRQYDRHGIITFSLAAERQAASGDVMMISDRFGTPYAKNPPVPGETRQPLERTQILTIRFVRADNGQIEGRMDPYWDPDRRCNAVALFRGSVDGDAIYGTVSSTCVSDPARRSLEGRWKVIRAGRG